MITNSTNQQDLTSEWARHVVWDQIFPERFWNGDPNNDPNNDPRVKALENSWLHNHKTGWQIHP